MKWRVLVSAPYMLPVIDRFLPHFAKHGIEIVVADVDERLEEEALLPLVGAIDGVICGDDRFTVRVLDAAPRLKAIAKWGTGIDSIDSTAARKRGIAILNTPDAFTEPVADTVLGYALDFARNLPFMDREMKAGGWHKIPGRTLAECVFGVIGVGAVGSAVLRRAKAFGAQLLGNDVRDIDAKHIAALNVQMVPLNRLLEEADFVSLNCDLNPSSHHLMDAAALGRMKTSAVLINTSRGPVVDEAALIRALEREMIAGAALDVFEYEPLAIDSPLRRFSNVLIAPHNSNSSPTAWEKVHWNTINQLVTCLEETA